MRKWRFVWYATCFSSCATPTRSVSSKIGKTMDSSDDELANNDTTTTPFRATKHVAASSTLNPAKQKLKANGRQPAAPVAGPSSSKPSSTASTTQQKTRTATRKKRNPSPVHEIDEDGGEEDNGEGRREPSGAEEEPIMIDVEAMDVETSNEAPARATRATRSKRAPSREPEATAPPPKPTTRPQQQQRGKGKAAARRNFSPNVMEIDSTDNAQGEESDAPVLATARKDKQKANGGTATVSGKEFARLQKENERLRQQVDELTRQRANIANQLEELANLRHTEAESNLEQLQQHYESRIQAQEEAIAELTSSSDLVNALQLRGKTSALHFLSHEAAEKEQLPLRNEIERLKGVIKEKGQDKADSEQRVRQLENTVKTLQSDLQIEIENSKKLANTHTGRAVKSDELKHGWVTKMYEDMTNFLVMSVKEEEVGDITGEPEHVFICVYSTTEMKNRALEFSLRVYKEEDADGERKDKCLYTPRNLEQESQEFIDGLGFLSDTFTFWRSQMEVFHERLKSTMSDMFGTPDEEES
ncbi:hypothetical protein SCHPADRAFT_513683 [Schizopora paradoxa]|uniref:Monopolin complex subunit Csm1/Pcs1 C-terminal domain-containing protein n=1 Tax=Schizopora paradoxa TaxID=27342 RepID=A0A0H2S0M2_9AGAM|nr:hypothetical protein SCHPADRAFT_513683 [Schizopora paradoxa]